MQPTLNPVVAIPSPEGSSDGGSPVPFKPPAASDGGSPDPFKPPANIPTPDPNDDNYVDILSAAVGAAAGVYTNAALARLSGQPINDIGLILSSGAGSIIGTTLHTLLNKEPTNLMLVNSIVGATGAMTGCTAGLLIAPTKEASDLYGILLTGGLAAIGAGSFIAVKQTLRQQPQLGCNSTYNCY